jgi:phosphoserine aminotransferase
MKNKKADFIITGMWAKKAYQEAKKYGVCRIVASSEDKNSHTSQKQLHLILIKMQIMFISAITIPFTEQNLKHSLTQTAKI